MNEESTEKLVHEKPTTKNPTPKKPTTSKECRREEKHCQAALDKYEEDVKKATRQAAMARKTRENVVSKTMAKIPHNPPANDKFPQTEIVVDKD